MKYERGNFLAELLMGLVGIAFVGGSIAAWITHLAVCFQGGKWGFLIAGAIFFPIAIVHGFGCWFSWW